jgi:hypothetical protein
MAILISVTKCCSISAYEETDIYGPRHSDLLILKILALEELGGWIIGQRLRQVSCDILQVGDGIDMLCST